MTIRLELARDVESSHVEVRRERIEALPAFTIHFANFGPEGDAPVTPHRVMKALGYFGVLSDIAHSRRKLTVRVDHLLMLTSPVRNIPGNVLIDSHRLVAPITRASLLI